MSQSEPYAQGQRELQSRLNKIHRERDSILNLLQKWTARAVAEATQASSVSEIENYAGPFTGGFASLDGIFRAFYQVHVFLSDETNFGVAGVPSVDLGAEANTPWHSAGANDDAETPSQDTDECYLSSFLFLDGSSSDNEDVGPEFSSDPATPSDGESEGEGLPEAVVQDQFTATTQQSSTSSPLATTEEAADGRSEADPSDVYDGPWCRSTTSQGAPEAWENGKAMGSEPYTSESLRDRAEGDAVDVVVERTVSCLSSQYDIPPADPVELGAVVKVFVSFFKTPHDFWLQLGSCAELLESFATSLAENCNAVGSPAGLDVRVGMSCAAQFGRDDRWHRARIVKILPDLVQVLYIDYGNEEVVQVDSLRPLAESQASVPALALHCSIPSVASLGSTGVWPLDAVRRFRDMLNDAGELQARFQGKDDLTGDYVVDLLNTPAAGQGRVNLSMKFLSECVDTMTRFQAPQTAVPPADTAPAVEELPVKALPVPCPPAPPLAAARPCVERSVQIPPPVQPEGDTFPVLITVIVSPTEFYVIPQVEDGLEKKMEDMQKRLAACAVASYPPTFDEVKEWTCWICCYERDGNWYRVRVTKIVTEDHDQRAQVYFVDFGDRYVASVSNLRPLPAHLAEMPACAHRMALSLVAPRGAGGGWDREAIDFFVANTGYDTLLEARMKSRRQLGFETVSEIMLNTSRKPIRNINVLLLEHEVAVLKEGTA